MKYDFTSIIDRHNKDSIAVDAIYRPIWKSPAKPKEGYSFIPLWVADMNFATCPAITEAIIERASHPLYGYFNPTDQYYDAIIKWHKKRNGLEISREMIGYENGVHGLVTSAVQVLTQPGDGVFVHSPVYVGYRSDIEGLGRHSIYSELKKDEDGIYRMDYEDMDRVIRENNVHLAILCSPHNPCGRVWTREELEKALAVFEKNECYVISDEIWSDLIMPGHKFVPTLSINDWAKSHVITATAISKTFNTAGLVASYHIIMDKYLRDRITLYGENTHYNEMNVFSEHALIAAYSEEGEAWLGELITVLNDNLSYVVDYIHKNFDGVSVTMPEGTYMLFIDFDDWLKSHGVAQNELLKKFHEVGVGVQDGRQFRGNTSIRMNTALPKSLLIEAMKRMNEVLNAFD